jgi:mannose-6-phosphate isomerase-like protein (cupin superfamily)
MSEHSGERGGATAKYHVSIRDAMSHLPGLDGERFAVVFSHGSLEVEVFAPWGSDTQLPHSRDEVYIVVTGTGEFINGADRNRFGPGDFLFVPAGVEHRFVDFSDDLVVWVLFYGPEGGEGERRG